MKRLLSFIMLTVIALSTVAQTPKDQRRLIIKNKNGKEMVYDISRLAELRFDSVAEVKTALSEGSATGYTLNVEVKMPEECTGYKLAVAEISDVVSDWASYIVSKEKAHGTESGSIEIGGLQPNTKYVVGSLAYDKYGMASGVSTITMTTTNAQESEMPQIGGILYADGSWSKDMMPGRTPVAIIFSTTTSDADKAKGFTHGYALALRNAGKKVKWSTVNNDYQTGEYTSSVEMGFQTDKDGLSHTEALLTQGSGLYPAADMAHDYDVPAPKGTSGWYLPSVGQWYDICVNIGGLSPEMPRAGKTEGYWNGLNDCGDCLGRINKLLSSTGSGNYEQIQVGSGDYQWFWSSSEAGKDQAYVVFFDKDQLVVELSGYFKNYDFSSNRVRAVIAF